MAPPDLFFRPGRKPGRVSILPTIGGTTGLCIWRMWREPIIVRDAR